MLPPVGLRLGNDPLVVLIENIDRLWEAKVRDELDGLVTWCYHSMVPLWCNFVTVAAKREGAEAFPSKFSTKSSFSRRISVLRNSSPANWLKTDQLFKLNEIADGGERLVPSPRRKRRETEHFDIY